MAGGFGAVVIMFLIINHATETPMESENRDLKAASRLLDYRIETGEENLSFIRNLVGNLSIRIADVEKRIDETIEELEIESLEVENIEKTAQDQTETLAKLITELEQTEREIESMERVRFRQQGQTTVEVLGEGDRQYLTGLFMGGEHIVIAVDVSASMLDQTIVNILRRRNMPIERQHNAPKWLRAKRTVTWLSANIPLESRFQIAVYNNQARFLTNNGQWIDASDGQRVREALDALETIVPKEGTNLKGLFELVSDIQPMPDNLFLLADGLPTMDAPTTRRVTIDSNLRFRLFHDAIRILPSGIPVNVIMFPLEGDMFAAASYWELGYRSGGTMITPSKDWP